MNTQTSRFNTENRHVYKRCFIDSRALISIQSQNHLFIYPYDEPMETYHRFEWVESQRFFAITKIERSIIYIDVNNVTLKKKKIKKN